MQIHLRSVFALLMVSVACTQEMATPDEKFEAPVFRACLEDQDKTVLMSDQSSVYWNPADEINIFYESNSWKYVSQNTEPAAEAIFKFAGDKSELTAVSGESKYWAYYPYSAENTFSTDRITVTIPTEQTATSGSFGRGDFPAITKSSDLLLNFKLVCSGVKFKVQKEGVTRVVFRANGGQTLSGKVKVGFATGGIPEVKQVLSGCDSIVVTSPVDSTFKVDTFYYISALPVTMSSGFTMTFSTGEASGSRSSSKSTTLHRAVFGNLGVADQGVTYNSVIESGVTVYGYVRCANSPIAGVVVSDGVLTTTTDGNGLYQLKSAKKNGLVYISVPAYYTVPVSGTQPQFYKLLTLAPSTLERKDFTLFKDPGQYNHTRFLFGDIHIYCSDADKGFSTFADKVNRELVKGVYKLPYGLTLGDMSYDMYWYYDENKVLRDYHYQIPEYLANINKINGLAVYCTVGNHDHDMKYNGQWWNSKNEYETTGEDWTCEIPYRAQQGPTCYSCNIGEVHYVSMDNAITIDDGTGEISGRGCYLGFTDADLAWLQKDMSYVDPAKTVVLTVHIPFTTEMGSFRSPTGHTLSEMLAPFKNRTGKLYVISAHQHRMFNNESNTTGGVTFSEWNTPAICGNFWRYMNKTVNICMDGVPAGFRVLEFNGPNVANSKYICTDGKDGDFYPFRSYDRNNILLPSSEYSTPGGFDVSNKENYVYIYVWDWNSKWSISISEAGYGKLTPTFVTQYDPLMIAASSQKLFSGSLGENTKTMRVKAHSATSTITIKVTDPYGNTATEVMKRPKPFTFTYYENELKYGYDGALWPSSNIDNVVEVDVQY